MSPFVFTVRGVQSLSFFLSSSINILYCTTAYSIFSKRKLFCPSIPLHASIRRKHSPIQIKTRFLINNHLSVIYINKNKYVRAKSRMIYVQKNTRDIQKSDLKPICTIIASKMDKTTLYETIISIHLY